MHIHGNTTDSENTWDMTMYITSTIQCIVLVVIIAGNILTILAFVKFHSLRTVRNYFILSLAVGDIFNGIVYMLILAFVVGQDHYWITHCPYQGSSVSPALLLVTTILSYLHIFVITFDCFICIVRPLHYHQLMSPRRATIIIAAIWIGSVLLGVVYLLKEKYMSEGTCASWPDIYSSCTTVITWLVVVVAVIVMYWKIFAIVHKQRRQIRELSLSSNADDNIIPQSENKNNTKRIVMVLVIIVAFIVLWLPARIAAIMTNFYRDTLVHGIGVYNSITLFIICMTFALCNSAVNVFIYARFDKDFRKAFRQILNCKIN